MSTEPTLSPCPFCGGAVMFRKALWPTDGCTDAIIHAAPTECGLAQFDLGTIDEGVIAAWNRRAGGEREQQLEALFQAAKPLFDDVQKTVAGWQRDPELPRHPGTLGWTPSKSNCRVAYAIADALGALAGQTEGERNGG